MRCCISRDLSFCGYFCGNSSNKKIPAHASFGTFSKSAFSCWGSLANPQNSSYNFLKLIEISQANFLNMGQFQGILYTIEVFLCYPAAPPLSGYPSWILKQWETCPRVTLKTHPNFIFSPLFIQINLRWKKHLYWYIFSKIVLEYYKKKIIKN